MGLRFGAIVMAIVPCNIFHINFIFSKFLTFLKILILLTFLLSWSIDWYQKLTF